MYRTPPEGDWFVYENDCHPIACRLSQVQWVSFPDSRKGLNYPAQIEFANGKVWFVGEDIALKIVEAIKLKALT